VAIVVVKAKHEDFRAAWAQVIMQVCARLAASCTCCAVVRAASQCHALTHLQIASVRQRMAVSLKGNLKKRKFWEVSV
jgi:hypothetical protein